jgi:hypothetical protein
MTGTRSTDEILDAMHELGGLPADAVVEDRVPGAARDASPLAPELAGRRSSRVASDVVS